MAQLVQNGDADLLAQLAWIGNDSSSGCGRSRWCREDAGHVAAFGERDAVVEAEQVRILWMLVLDDDGDVLERSGEVGAKARREQRERGRRTSPDDERHQRLLRVQPVLRLLPREARGP